MSALDGVLEVGDLVWQQMYSPTQPRARGLTHLGDLVRRSDRRRDRRGPGPGVRDYVIAFILGLVPAVGGIVIVHLIAWGMARGEARASDSNRVDQVS